MELAIVIPYYRRTFFEATLESLAAQTDRRFKVYIGDDASPDNPWELLQKYNGRVDFVYHQFEANLGAKSLVKQWERCLELTSAEEWVMILGDDDVLAGNAVAEFHKSAGQNQAKVFRFATQLIDASAQKTTGIYTHPNGERATDFMFRKSRSSLSEYVFSTAQIDKIGFKNLPLAWFSDLLAVLEFSDFGPVGAINEAVVYVRVSDESISGTPKGFIQKNAAAFAFYAYLLTKKRHHFKKRQQRKLFSKINKCYCNDKKNIGTFLKLSYIYLRGFHLKGYLDFLQSIAVSVKNKKA